jgi:large subunit ribosomal protein L31e
VVCASRALFSSGFKKRAPRAVSEIRKFATAHMGTADVRIDADLNKAVWSHGIKSVWAHCVGSICHEREAL